MWSDIDLSCFTEEERRKMEEVFVRHANEEAKEMVVVNNLASEVKEREQRVVQASQADAASRSLGTFQQQWKYDFHALQTQMLLNLAQQQQGNKKNVSSIAAAIFGLKKDSRKPTFTASGEFGHQSSPVTLRGATIKPMSKDSTDGGVSSRGGRSHHGGHVHVNRDFHLSSFIEPLGPGQVVGRQVLASPCFGEMQMNIRYKKGHLEITVVRGHLFDAKPGRTLPACLVKIELLEGKHVVAKDKTTTAERCRDPLFSQTIIFNEPHEHRHLHATVWGNYGWMEKKIFMGLAVIALDDLDLSMAISGWFKLFNSDTFVAGPQ